MKYTVCLKIFNFFPQDCLDPLVPKENVAREESKVSEDHREISDLREQLDNLVLMVTLEQQDHLVYLDPLDHLETL